MNSRTAKILQLAAMQNKSASPEFIENKTSNINDAPYKILDDAVVIFDNILSPEDLSNMINEAEIIFMEDDLIPMENCINIQTVASVSFKENYSTQVDTEKNSEMDINLEGNDKNMNSEQYNRPPILPHIDSTQDGYYQHETKDSQNESGPDYLPNKQDETEEENEENIEPTSKNEEDPPINNNHEENNTRNHYIENEDRKKKPRMSKRKTNKKKRMLGEAFVGFTKPAGQKNTFHNTNREQRVLKSRCKCSKKLQTRRCCEIGEENRLHIFDKFWKKMNWGQRKVYVSNTVEKVPTKRPKYHENNEEVPRRTGTFIYHLMIENKKVPVCKTLYLNTLCLGEWSVKHWVEESKYGMNESEASRNTTRTRRSDMFQEDKAVLRQFLEKLNKLPSHYCRKDTTKLYLEEAFQSFAQLHREYEKFCVSQDKQPLCFSILRQMLTEMNIAIFHPRKDQCNTCFKYKNKNLAQGEYEQHIHLKDRARQEKNEAKEQAKLGNCLAITMDVQAVKLCPQIPANALYYKTKLCCHNFTIYNIATKQCTCYWYDEITADGQASVYASFLIDYLEGHCITGSKKPIIIFSDGCTAQNRNSVLSNALLYLSEKHEITITQKFLIKGHTQMECDSVHSAIETALKNKDIYLPHDYVTVTKSARKTVPYEAKKPPHTFFLNYAHKPLMKFDSIRPGKVVHDPAVTDICALKYENAMIQYKLNFDEDFKELPRRPKKVDWNINSFPKLFENRLSIPKRKYQHLQEIKQVIPQDYWTFYDELPHNN